MRSLPWVFIVTVSLCLGSTACSKKKANDGSDKDVTARGTIEVTAKLVEIPGLEQWDGQFPSNDLGYDYVYIMKYQVEQTHRGEVSGDTILVGHYNPLKPRSQAADVRCEDIGGTVERFRVGDVHRLALEVPIDDYYMGPIINKYFDTPLSEQPLHLAVWSNRVVR